MAGGLLYVKGTVRRFGAPSRDPSGPATSYAAGVTWVRVVEVGCAHPARRWVLLRQSGERRDQGATKPPPPPGHSSTWSVLGASTIGMRHGRASVEGEPQMNGATEHKSKQPAAHEYEAHRPIEDSPEERTYSPPTLRVVAIMEELAASTQPLRTSTLSRRLGLSRSTCTAILSTLERTGWLERNDQGYFPGLGLVPLSSAVSRWLPSMREVGVILRDLAAQVEGSVLLNTPSNERYKVVMCVEVPDLIPHAPIQQFGGRSRPRSEPPLSPTGRRKNAPDGSLVSTTRPCESISTSFSPPFATRASASGDRAMGTTIMPTPSTCSVGCLQRAIFGEVMRLASPGSSLWWAWTSIPVDTLQLIYRAPGRSQFPT